MSLAGFQFHQFGIFLARRPVAYLVLIAHGDGGVGIKSVHTAVFHKDAGHTVYGSRDDVFVSEADVLGIGLDEAVEIGSAFGTESQVPFADGGGGISFLLEHVGHGDAGRVDDEFRIAGSDACILLPPGIHAGQQSEAGRCAGRRGGVGIGELQSLSGKAVEVGRTDSGSSVATQVTDAQIVGNEVDNVGLLGVLCIFGIFGRIAACRQ